MIRELENRRALEIEHFKQADARKAERARQRDLDLAQMQRNNAHHAKRVACEPAAPWQPASVTDA